MREENISDHDEVNKNMNEKNTGPNELTPFENVYIDRKKKFGGKYETSGREEDSIL